MAPLPNYVGPAAFGIKMGVIVPGMDLIAEVVSRVAKCAEDQLVDDGDVLCITESVVARSQNNYVTVGQIAEEIRGKLDLPDGAAVGVVFPILSRNRFSLILKAIARATGRGQVVMQLSWPADEVGNRILTDEQIVELGKNYDEIITEADLAGKPLLHPITGVDYLQLYRALIEQEGAAVEIYLANDPTLIANHGCHGIITADIHSRAKTKAAVEKAVEKLSAKTRVASLVDICADKSREAWSEWGLLGSNMSAGEKLKLAPRNGSEFAAEVQAQVERSTGKHVEVIIYGDGAYKDPSTGIYELADPLPVLGATAGIAGMMREGIKYKYVADVGLAQGKTAAEIEKELVQLKGKNYLQSDTEVEGTTPRKMGDVIASLADLISGSADAGTPLVIVKGFVSPE